jgi:hypothetical protein
MPKSVLLLAAMFEIFVMPISLASAQTAHGMQSINAATQNFTPIQRAACQGWGPYCRPGYIITCGRWRCWCRPCV